ncbi:MAG: DivIVA domain-containing protein [Gaiellaceae bacterium]
MALAPVELRHIRLKRGLLGYRRRAVDDLIAEVTDSFEEVWRERADLRDHVDHLDNELRRHRELESLLRETLTTAEKSAAELKEQARGEAELVVREAHANARFITQDALAERERLAGEAARTRALLRHALASAEEADPARAEREAQAA